MAIVRRVLIIGGGFSGMSAALELRKRGIEVDLVEIDAGWRSYGAGITINGATLRAFGTVGVLPRIMAEGYCADGCDLFSASGHKLGEVPTPRLAGPDVPGGGGIMRPVLARILSDATRASGASVRLGCTFNSIRPQADGVQVSFTDGSSSRYDLAIGADGLFSKTRAAIFPQAPKPRYTGQGVWRAVAPRPETVQRPAMYLGAHTKAGVNPVSRKEMYLFVTESRPTNSYVPESELTSQLSALLAEFSVQVLRDVRDRLGPDSRIVYRPLEALLAPEPWFSGRVVLIGDAVHATTPHLAAGAGLGIEDAIVLAEALGGETSVDAALAAFQRRRFERCRLVVQNSLRLGEIEATGGSPQEHGDIMRNSFIALARPI